MANYGCGKGMNEENLLAMRRRVLELDANPHIKPTALEKAFLEAYRERKKGAHGRQDSLPSSTLSKLRPR